jgi:peptidoglycan hydrolase-like protein with peptidoglycan-binding domain
LQHSLNAIGFDLVEDGQYGGFTELAIIRFQKSRGLVADGIAASRTVPALDRAANSPPSMNPPVNTVLPERSAMSLNRGGVVTISGGYYASRSATRDFEAFLNDPETDLAKDVGGAILCDVAGRVSWLHGKACDGIVISVNYAMARAVNDAAHQGACLRVKYIRLPTGDTIPQFLTDNGRNCID